MLLAQAAGLLWVIALIRIRDCSIYIALFETCPSPFLICVCSAFISRIEPYIFVTISNCSVEQISSSAGRSYMFRGDFKIRKGDLDGAIADFNQAIEGFAI